MLGKKLTAEQLYPKSQERQIKQVVYENVQAIRQRMQDAREAGKSEIDFTITDTFTVSTIPQLDLEVIIVSEIIENIEHDNIKVGYDPLIHTFVISWPSIFDKKEYDRRKAVINKHLIKIKKN